MRTHFASFLKQYRLLPFIRVWGYLTMKKQTVFGITLFIIFILASVQAFAAVTYGAVTATDPVEAGVNDVILSAEISSDGTLTSVTLLVDGVDYSSSLSTTSPYTATLSAALFVSTDPNHGTLGTHSYIFTATDESGDTPTSGTFTTEDLTAPSITILDANPATVEVGTTYTDAGATAADAYEGDVTSSITSTSTVDINTVGTYEVTYTVADTTGNSATATRTVNVVDATPPTISITSAPTEVEYGNNALIVATVTDNYDLDETSVDLTLSDGTVHAMAQTGTDEYTANIETTGLSLTTYQFTITAEDASGNVATTDGTDEFTVEDTTGPLITEVSTPDAVVCYESSITFSATVEDLYDETPAYVGIYVDGAPGDATNGPGYYQLDQNTDDPTLYELTVDTTTTDFSNVGDYTGDYLYNFYARDSNTNAETTDAASFSIADCTGPEITNVTESSDPVEYEEDIIITATITEQTGIATDFEIQYITVYDSTGAVVYTADLDPIGANQYEVTINTETNLGTIGEFSYIISATNDDDATGTSTEATFIVTDTTGPTVTIVSESPDPVEYGEDITITATVTDGNGVGTVLLSISSASFIEEMSPTANPDEYSLVISTSDLGILGEVTYSITATDVYDNSGASTEGTFEVVDTTAPVITILGNNPETVELGSTYTDAGATAYDAHDGDLTSSIIPASTVDTSAVGTYDVTYSVTDSAGYTTTETRTVEVVDTTSPTISNVVASPNRVNEGDIVTISADVTDAQGIDTVTVTVNGADYSMTGSGDTYSADINTTGFALATYTFTITATDDDGNTRTASGSFTVTIVSAITVEILADKTSGEEDLDVSFRSNTAGGVVPLHYAWDFDDGDVSGSQNVRHVFTNDGVYTVTLTVSDDYGNVGTDTITITVGAEETTNNARDNIRLDEISFGNDVVEAGDLLEAFVTIENIGEERLEDISVTLYIDELGIWARSTQEDVSRGDDEPMVVALEIPEDAEPGFYDVRIVISNDDMKRVKYRDIEII